MGVETLRGYNLYQPPDCNPKTRDHKQASIFVEFTDVFRLTENSETHVHAAASRLASGGPSRRSGAYGPIQSWVAMLGSMDDVLQRIVLRIVKPTKCQV